MHEEAKLLELQFLWVKTKMQVFGGLLDEKVESVHAWGKAVEIFESFTYLGSIVHSTMGSCQESLKWIGLAFTVMGKLNMST